MKYRDAPAILKLEICGSENSKVQLRIHLEQHLNPLWDLAFYCPNQRRAAACVLGFNVGSIRQQQ